ncbi:MAG: nucleotidyltransferase substrate binding protein (TIGR01987 family) [Candidatus Latescibacterota bacterium]|jgi:nucleotidyltransferase substrate binding protein (TIGR01987 family)
MRLSDARQALTTLFELCDLAPPTDVERDAAIQRFEYSFETVWKAAQQILLTEGMEANSPRFAIRLSRTIGFLTDEQAEDGLRMLTDRNLTSHTYRSTLAKEVFSRLAGHARLLDSWLRVLESRLDANSS